MLQALLAGVASMKAQQTRMNVIGNNLANVNTTAYKSERVTFEEMISQTLTGATRPSATAGGRNPIQYGLGVLVAGTDVNNAQGSLAATNRVSDLAIQGNGFFMVSDSQGISYTRDGSLDLDANGDIVQTATGQRLLGWEADSSGVIDTSKPLTAASSINIPLGSLKAVQATTDVVLNGNLNASAAATDTWSTTVRVYDSLGTSHDISITFSNHSTTMGTGAPTGAVASWQWAATEGTTDIGNSGTTGNDLLYFDSGGSMVNSATAQTIVVPGSGGAANSSVKLDFGSLTQLDTSTQVQVASQNGFPPGSLESYSFGADGVIRGTFTNGLTRPLGQIALSIFPNPAGLERTGENLWRSTDNSGVAVVGSPSTGGRGSINAGFLEQSNVDIANEFTDLIVTQRGYQANTKVVTTVDQMLQDLIGIIR